MSKPSKRPAHETAAARVARLQREDRAARARPQPIATHVYVIAGELARETGRDVADVLDTYDEQLSIARYDGLADPERVAWQATERIYTRRAA